MMNTREETKKLAEMVKEMTDQKVMSHEETDDIRIGSIEYKLAKQAIVVLMCLEEDEENPCTCDDV